MVEDCQLRHSCSTVSCAQAALVARAVVHHDPGIVLFVPGANSGVPPTNHTSAVSSHAHVSFVQHHLISVCEVQKRVLISLESLSKKKYYNRRDTRAG